jgi:hypothetical protein
MKEVQGYTMAPKSRAKAKSADMRHISTITQRPAQPDMADLMAQALRILDNDIRPAQPTGQADSVLPGGAE